LSNIMDTTFCVDALDEALARFGKPQIFNTQGSQFTSADHRAAALRTRDQPREGEIVRHSAVLGSEAAVEHALYPFPQIDGDQRLVPALIALAVPVKLSRVEPVTEDGMHRTDRLRWTPTAGPLGHRS
jgi:transposase InsO family protein